MAGWHAIALSYGFIQIMFHFLLSVHKNMPELPEHMKDPQRMSAAIRMSPGMLHPLAGLAVHGM